MRVEKTGNKHKKETTTALSKVTTTALIAKSEGAITTALINLAAAIMDLRTSDENLAMLRHRIQRKWAPAMEECSTEIKRRLMTLFDGQENAEAQVGVYKVGLRRAFSKEPEEKVFRLLLEKKGINPLHLYDQVISYKLNPDRLAEAISVNQLTQEEVDACKREISKSLLIEMTENGV